MVNPVPGFRVTTPYGRRGRHWSCNRNAQGHGVHTGADFAAPNGTRVVAARPGVVRHVSFGAAFGPNQVLIVVDAAAGGGADFYAHLRRRTTTAGGRVTAGQTVGEVGALGNATGPHLHFERHRNPNAGWSCSNHTDPAPSINWTPPNTAPPGTAVVRLSQLRLGTRNSEDVRHLQRRLNIVQQAGLPITGNYLEATDREVRRHQRANGFNPTGTQGSDHVGPRQAETLFRGTNITVRDDR